MVNQNHGNIGVGSRGSEVGGARSGGVRGDNVRGGARGARSGNNVGGGGGGSRSGGGNGDGGEGKNGVAVKKRRLKMKAVNVKKAGLTVVVKKNTKEQILNGAIELFSQKGYTETSMREIAISANIQPGSIYNHFPSKQELLEHIIRLYAEYIEGHSLLSQAVERLNSGADMTVDEVMSCMALSFPKGEENRYRKMLHILLHEQYRNETVRHYIVDEFLLKNERYVRQVVEKLVEKGAIRPVDSDMIAKLHIATIYLWSSANQLGIDAEPPFVRGNSMADVLRFIYSDVLGIRNS
ncbi:MAG: TetR/AcrR family transcriptional regulator [Clostridiales bacterium]|nr:TetR/AcrR family transcriptional regulator [Clostridiales bacterium]